MATRDIHVYAHWEGLPDAVPMGVLSVHRSRGREIYSFAYHKAWIARAGHVVLDPGLRFFGGPQYPTGDRPGFGLFLDSAPDRWGRMLMQRREALIARREGRAVRTLLGSDHLLGVSDHARMGGLRFKLDPAGPFLNDDPALAIPPMERLRELERASLALEDDGDDAPGDDRMRWLDLLLAPGSSLGGARPKASVVDERGHLWIAKFPSRNDEVDKGAWELVAHELAIRCGITVAPARALRLKGPGHTFLARRFDRSAKGVRTHFASAMTMLGRTDGDDATTGASYLELAEFLMRHGARTDADLHQLWKRIVLNILIGNTDDHLRNHGFLLRDGGWELAPAYDLNPEPHGRGLSLNIDMHSNALSLGLAMEVAPYFRLSPRRAASTVRALSERVAKDRVPIAKEAGLSRREMERMEAAFMAHQS